MTENIVYALAILSLFIIGAALFAKVLKNIASRYDARASESFRLISNSQKGILIFIGSALALSKLGFDISALVAGLGLTGFAVGFALKDAISNLVAGIMIVLYKPIELGNIVEVSDVKGEVVDLNLRYLTINSGEMIHLIPNSLLLNTKVSIFDEKTNKALQDDR